MKNSLTSGLLPLQYALKNINIYIHYNNYLYIKRATIHNIQNDQRDDQTPTCMSSKLRWAGTGEQAELLREREKWG